MTSAAALFSEVILILGKYVIRCFTYNSVEKKTWSWCWMWCCDLAQLNLQKNNSKGRKVNYSYFHIQSSYSWPCTCCFWLCSVQHTMLYASLRICGNRIQDMNSWPLLGMDTSQLTHWGWDKMAVISQTTFSNALSWMKKLDIWLKFHWRLFLRVELIMTQHWFSNGLALNRRQAIIWSNADPFQWCLYVALGGDELRMDIACKHGQMVLHHGVGNLGTKRQNVELSIDRIHPMGRLFITSWIMGSLPSVGIVWILAKTGLNCCHKVCRLQR